MNIEIDKFMAWLDGYAVRKRNDAAYSGAAHDGGYKNIMDQISCYLSGAKGQLPTCWDKYKKQYELESQEDYNTYLRLKRKYEG